MSEVSARRDNRSAIQIGRTARFLRLRTEQLRQFGDVGGNPPPVIVRAQSGSLAAPDSFWRRLLFRRPVL